MPTACPECGTPWNEATLSCPSCHRLVHGATLSELVGRAKGLETENAHEARSLYEQALALLPPNTKQREQLELRIGELAAVTPDGQTHALPSTESAAPKRKGWLAALVAIGLLLWKLKAVLVFLLSKAKFLLLGLTKWKTAFSMLLSLGVYWSVWGWPFALGFVLSIYVHEMGHVAALRHFGLPASAPMFIPGVGAFVRLKQAPESPEQDARIGLAGPIAGLGAAFACYALYLATELSIFAALAKTGAWINLFNLIPIWQLDGGRAFNALDRRDRWIAFVIILAAWAVTAETMLLLVLLGAGYRAGFAQSPERRDQGSLIAYAALIVTLASLTAIHVPMDAAR